MTGRVARINQRGFAFLQTDDGSSEFYAHSSGFAGGSFGRAQVGDRVSFDATTDRSGRPQAENVLLLENATPMFGKITSIAKDRGFAFIRPDDGSRDVFLHSNRYGVDAFADLRTGDRMEFAIVHGRGKSREAVSARREE